MKKFNALNFGKSLNREEMKSINGGTAAYKCICGTLPPSNQLLGGCSCLEYCAGSDKCIFA